MNIKYLNNKKICILGLGIENLALVKFLLKKKVNCQITICDSHKDVRRPSLLRQSGCGGQVGRRTSAVVRWQLGKNYDHPSNNRGAGKNLNQFDIIFRSPGYPLFKLQRRGIARNARTEISSPMKLFFDLCPSKNIIGVTGTKGKGTTASLIYHILKKGFEGTGRDLSVHLGGNIGVAPFEFIEKIKKNDWVILELSSFQLEDMTVSPKIAVITNFYREHLAPADPNNPNYHRSMREYWHAKLNIVKWQKKNDKIILNNNLKARFRNLAFRSKIIFFTKLELPSKLIGEHNKENIAAAVEVAKIVGIKPSIIKKAVASFKGLEHRLEYIKTVKGVKYYNDSFATTPESAITALKSFSQPIILLAGGAEKKSDFKKLAREIKKRVKFVVLLNGKATPRLKKELLKTDFTKDHPGKDRGTGKIKLVFNIREAVKVASKNAGQGNVVLLSPACASFGMFKNYKERGALFKREVKKL